MWGRPVVSPGVWTFCRLNRSQSRRECISQTRANPEGISSFSPGLRAARYPGCVSPSTPSTLKGLHRLPSHHRQSLACRSVEKTVRIRILAGDCARAAIMDQGAGDSDKIPSLAAASPQNVQTPEREMHKSRQGRLTPLRDRSTVRDLSGHGRWFPTLKHCAYRMSGT